MGGIIKCFNRKCGEFDEGAVDHCGAVLVSIRECPKGAIRKDKPPTNDYRKALASNECACGKEKKPRMAFCYRCYSSLPQEIKSELWRRLNIGFENDYEAAVKWLEENIW